MKYPSYIYIRALVLIGVFIPVLSLNCYQCKSEDDSDCQENYDHESPYVQLKSTKCTIDNAQFCIKTTGVWGGIVGTQRFCSAYDLGDQCQYLTYPDHDRKYRACTYTCNGSDCNSATRHTGLFTAIVTTVACIIYMHS